VKARDRTTFRGYVDRRVPLTARLPGGKRFDDGPSFLRSQDEWFSGSSGRFDDVIERAEASEGLGLVWVRATFANVDANGNPFRLALYLTLLFRRLEDRWCLMHDQNTVVPHATDDTAPGSGASSTAVR
jgi:hypothetical protein